MIQIKPGFYQRCLDIHGEKGKKWLAKLPQTIAKLTNVWDLSSLKPIEDLSYNLILMGYQKDIPIVLKLSCDQDALKSEVASLKTFKSNRGAKVLNYTLGAMLLKQTLPGHSLNTYFPDREEESIIIASETISVLHNTRYMPTLNFNKFQAINTWLEGLDCNYDYDIPIKYLHKARILKDKLLAIEEPMILLHGDLHHGNILVSQNSYEVIDPKGVIGPQIYEVGAFIRNPLPQLLESKDLPRVINNRIITFAKILNFNEQKIREWSYVQAVLAWIWAIQDNLQTQDFAKLVELFNEEIVI